MLWLTGLFFLTNAAHAAARGFIVYAVAFAALAATSYALHSMRQGAEQRQLMYWLDQLALWCIILIGAFYWQQLTPENRWIPLACIAAVGALWFGGRSTESFAYSPDDSRRLPAHGILHFLSSIGHHSILAAL